MPSLQSINLGSYANDGTGDDLRTAFEKVNNNFGLLFDEASVNTAINVGSGIGIFAQKNLSTVNLEFKTLTSTNASMSITETANTVNLQANTKLLNDTLPKLGATLDLNGHNIAGNGDIQATVHGYDLALLNNTLQLILESGAVNIDLGTFINPTGDETDGLTGSGGYLLDMGLWTFGDPKPNNQLNFGTFV
jgi:hypothetical protein